MQKTVRRAQEATTSLAAPPAFVETEMTGEICKEVVTETAEDGPHGETIAEMAIARDSGVERAKDAPGSAEMTGGMIVLVETASRGPIMVVDLMGMRGEVTAAAVLANAGSGLVEGAMIEAFLILMNGDRDASKEGEDLRSISEVSVEAIAATARVTLTVGGITGQRGAMTGEVVAAGGAEGTARGTDLNPVVPCARMSREHQGESQRKIMTRRSKMRWNEKPRRNSLRLPSLMGPRKYFFCYFTPAATAYSSDDRWPTSSLREREARGVK